MRLRSKGLGRKELVMDFREYDISLDGDDVIVSGTIRAPVTWDFSIRFSQADIPGLLRVGLSRHVLRMALRWVLRRPARSPEGTPAPAGGAAPPRPVAAGGPPARRQQASPVRVGRVVPASAPPVASPAGGSGSAARSSTPAVRARPGNGESPSDVSAAVSSQPVTVVAELARRPEPSAAPLGGTDTPARSAAPAPSTLPRKTRVRRTVDDASPLVARPTGKTPPTPPRDAAEKDH
jgi:hypothetical protein